MYAVIEQGGKQYKVSAGDVINIELTDVAPEAESIELNNNFADYFFFMIFCYVSIRFLTQIKR